MANLTTLTMTSTSDTIWLCHHKLEQIEGLMGEVFRSCMRGNEEQGCLITFRSKESQISF
ncbi:unnamed protein product [Prunus armeniaca]|uniref:Uncharacterized protein n=1 Tax=Prunus armeniaca TaxID=36596 RepID=A0A6J5UQ47_PRUAR|nr:unnamed protein product [Prunus armeniaca]